MASVVHLLVIQEAKDSSRIRPSLALASRIVLLPCAALFNSVASSAVVVGRKVQRCRLLASLTILFACSFITVAAGTNLMRSFLASP